MALAGEGKSLSLALLGPLVENSRKTMPSHNGLYDPAPGPSAFLHSWLFQALSYVCNPS